MSIGIKYIYPFWGHEQIDARSFTEKVTQASDPFAPGWNHLSRLTVWWTKILEYREAAGFDQLLRCPEFGPAPYMPCYHLRYSPWEPMADHP